MSSRKTAARTAYAGRKPQSAAPNVSVRLTRSAAKNIPDAEAENSEC